MYGKRVVVIGIGNSGGDIAVEASRVAEQVRKSFWLLFSFLHITRWFVITHVFCLFLSLCRCIWAPVVVPGSSVRFLTMACRWTWNTIHGLSTSCSSCCQWTSSTGLARRNSMLCMTTPCMPSNLHTGKCQVIALQENSDVFTLLLLCAGYKFNCI